LVIDQIDVAYFFPGMVPERSDHVADREASISLGNVHGHQFRSGCHLNPQD
jgi:hypothetical protein